MLFTEPSGNVTYLKLAIVYAILSLFFAFYYYRSCKQAENVDLFYHNVGKSQSKDAYNSTGKKREEERDENGEQEV